MSINNIQYYIQYYSNSKDEILNLLGSLTLAPVIADRHFETIIAGLTNNHQIFAYIKDDKLVGLITLLIEQKLIHGGRCVAHIEDLIVNNDYRGQGIANALIDYCIKQTAHRNCYKIVLSCKRELISFYERFGLAETNVQMSMYLDPVL